MTASLSADRDRMIHILVVHFDMFRDRAEAAADLFLHHKTLAPPTETAWECKDYADGWIRFDTLEQALEYQYGTGCIMRPIRPQVQS